MVDDEMAPELGTDPIENIYRFAGNIEILGTRGRVPARMVVRQDDAAAQPTRDCPRLDDVAGVDEGCVDRPGRGHAVVHDPHLAFRVWSDHEDVPILRGGVAVYAE